LAIWFFLWDKLIVSQTGKMQLWKGAPFHSTIKIRVLVFGMQSAPRYHTATDGYVDQVISGLSIGNNKTLMVFKVHQI
jgi:hypothetical protein